MGIGQWMLDNPGIAWIAIIIIMILWIGEFIYSKYKNRPPK